jgi:superfamily I DNA and/or RNA helicase
MTNTNTDLIKNLTALRDVFIKRIIMIDTNTTNTDFIKNLTSLRENLLDLTKRNHLIHSPIHKRDLKIIDEIPNQIFEYLYSKGKTFDFLPIPKDVDSLKKINELIDERSLIRHLLLEMEVLHNYLIENIDSIDLDLYPFLYDSGFFDDYILSDDRSLLLTNLKSYLIEIQDHLNEINLLINDLQKNNSKPINSIAKDLGFDLNLKSIDYSSSNRKHFDTNIQTLHYQEELNSILKSLSKKEQTIQENIGINSLYLTFYSLKWNDFFSPIVLIPVKLSKNSDGFYSLSSNGTDIESNIPLLKKFKLETNITLPHFDTNHGLLHYLKKFKNKIKDTTFEIESTLRLQVLNTQKSIMYEDLAPLDILNKPNFFKNTPSDDLFSNIILGNEAGINLHTKSIGLEPKLFTSADSSQLDAMKSALNGNNLVIEGPPGTGKSQTITNLIVNLLEQGKKVLFVSEKMAALDVVYNRLDELGFGDFGLKLHSDNSNKNLIIKSIKRGYESYIPDYYIDSTIVPRITDKNNILSNYKQILQKKITPINKTIFEIIGISSKLNSQENIFYFLFNFEELITETEYLHIRHLLEEYSNVHSSIKQTNSIWDFYSVNEIVDHSDVQTILKVISNILKDIDIIKKYLNTSLNVDFYHKILEFKKSVNEYFIIKTQFSIQSDFNIYFSLSENYINIDKINDKINYCIIDFSSDHIIIDDLITWPDHIIDLLDNDILNYINDYLPLQDFFQHNIHVYGLDYFYDLKKDTLQHFNYFSLNENLQNINLDKSKLSSFIDIIHDNETLFDNDFSISNIQHTIESLQFLLTIDKDILPYINNNLTTDFLKDVIFNIKTDVTNIKSKYLKYNLDSLSYISIEELEYNKNIILNSNFVTKLFSKYKKSYSFFTDFIQPGYTLSVDSTDIFTLIKIKKELNLFFKQYSNNEWMFTEGFNTNLDSLFNAVSFFENLKSIKPSHQLISSFLNNPITLLDISSKVITSFDNCSFFLQYYIELKNNNIKSNNLNISDLQDFIDLKIYTLENIINRLNVIFPDKTISFDDFFLEFELYVNEMTPKYKKIINYIETFTNSNNIDLNELVSLKKILSERTSIRDLVTMIFEKNKLLEINSSLLESTCSSDINQNNINNITLILNNISSLVNENIELQPIFSLNTNEINNLQDIKDITIDSITNLKNNLIQFDKYFSWDKENLNLDLIYSNFSSLLSESSIIRSYISLNLKKKDILKYTFIEKYFLHFLNNNSPIENIEDNFVFNLFNSLALNIIDQEPELKNFNRCDHEEVINQYQKLDSDLLSYNKNIVKDKILKLRTINIGKSGLAKEQTELNLLKRVMPQTRPRISIKDLFFRAQQAIKEIKPLFLMSPLSVSQYLPMENNVFDVLIIDEASQLRIEDSLGSIYRCSQVVVVGDKNQLPPVNYFSSDSDLGLSDNDLLNESESILEVLERIINNNKRLSWHYRSKHQDLISYSNNNFYNNSLKLFPSPNNNTNLGIDYIYIPDSYTENSINILEAKMVVVKIKDQIRKNPNKSIGVGTFNKKQAEYIESLIDIESDSDMLLRNYLSNFEKTSNYLFFKNIVNIQGDERDVIIISTLYGLNRKNNIVNQRFGDINKKDGWRFLNVLFSRSKEKLIIITSLKASDIKVDDFDFEKKSKLAFKNLFKGLENNSQFGDSNVIEQSNSFYSDFEEDVFNHLTSKGFKLKTQVGISGLFIDLSVYDKNNKDFILGIEFDGSSNHSSENIRDSIIIKQQILKNMGWSIHKIYSTDWFRNKDSELKLIIDKINKI